MLGWKLLSVGESSHFSSVPKARNNYQKDHCHVGWRKKISWHGWGHKNFISQEASYPAQKISGFCLFSQTCNPTLFLRSFFKSQKRSYSIHSGDVKAIYYHWGGRLFYNLSLVSCFVSTLVPEKEKQNIQITYRIWTPRIKNDWVFLLPLSEISLLHNMPSS